METSSSQPELLQLFPKPVLILKYQENFSDELEYVKNIEYGRKNGDNEYSGFNYQSTDTFILQKPELSKIKQFIESGIKIYAENILQTTTELIITQSWANKTAKNESHHEHIHPNSIASGVFYFQIDQTLPPIKFISQNTSQFAFETTGFNNFNSQVFLLPLDSGELIIFPSDLKHSVPINTSQKDRISLSFNTFTKGNLGSIDSLTYLPIENCI